MTNKQEDRTKKMSEENSPSVLPCGHEPGFWGSGVPPSWPASQGSAPRVLGSSDTMSPHPAFSLSEKLNSPSLRAGREELNLQTLQGGEEKY